MNRLLILPAIAMLMGLYIPAAGGAVEIKSVTFCEQVDKNMNPVKPCEGFTSDSMVLHALVTLAQAQAESTAKGTWISIDAISVANHPIDSVSVPIAHDGEATLHFSLSRPNNGWPTGRYKLLVQIEGLPNREFPFSILPAINSKPPVTGVPPDNAAISQKLEALKQAHEAGILTDAEFVQKKTSLEAKLNSGPPILDPSSQKKLNALDAARQAGILSNEEYHRKRQGVLNAAAPSITKPTGTPHPTKSKVPLKPGQTYRHSAGFSFWYPVGWKITAQDELLQLAPPNPQGTSEAPLELYFLAVESLQGQEIKRPDDPQMLSYLDEQIKSLSPLLNRTGTSRTVSTPMGQAVRLDWQAKSPEGPAVLAQAYAVISKNQSLMLVAMGLKKALQQREADLRDMFGSMTWGDIPQTPSATSTALPGAAPRPTPTPTIDPALQEKLHVLDKAYTAGVLSEEEFRRKKAALTQSASMPDETTQKKLQALEEARRLGILSEQEYIHKKNLFLKTGSQSGRTTTPATEFNSIRYAEGQKGKMYQHVIGFSFWHPTDWRIQKHDEFLQLVPPNASTSADGPEEFYFVIAESVAGEGITSPGDPAVLQFLDQQVMQIAPFLQRTTGTEPVQMAHSQGVHLKWQGTNPKGQIVQARAYVSIIKQYGVALLTLGYQKPVEARESDVRRIFASFGFGPGQLDPQLVGKWNFLTTTSMTNWSVWETDYSRASLVSESTALLEFRPDGTWMRTDNSQMLAGAGGVWIESNEKKVDQGKWYAGKGDVYLISQDNTWEDYKYSLRQTQQGIQLLLAGGKRGELWKKAD